MPNAQDLALGIPGDEMQATPTLNLAQAPQQEAAQPAGLDLAKPVSAQRQFINTLSSGERFGTMLQEFGAALQGKPSPIQARMESERKNKLLQLAEGKAAVDAISNGLKYAQALPPGPQREKAVSLFAKTLPDNLRSEFVDLANDPVASENGAVFAEDPRSAATAHAICSQAGDYGECMKAFVKDPAKNKMLLQSIDRPILPDIQAKLESIASIPEVKEHIAGMLAKGQYPSISTLRDSMKKLPPELQLTSNEMLTVQRNQDILPRFGIYTDDMVKSEIVKERTSTIQQGHVPGVSGSEVNLRINKLGEMEAEVGGKWVPKPANIVVGPPNVSQIAAKKKETDIEESRASLNKQITDLQVLITDNEGLFTGTVGAKGWLGRTVETVRGLFPGQSFEDTPALQAVSKKELIIANIRKLLDSGHFTNKDKERVDAAIGQSQASTTAGNAIKSLENLREFLKSEPKETTKKNPKQQKTGKPSAKDFFK